MHDKDKVNLKVTGVASAYPGDRTKVPAFRTRARHVKLQPIMRVLPRRILTKSHYLANASAQSSVGSVGSLSQLGAFSQMKRLAHAHHAHHANLSLVFPT